jgi:hypothetical protein
VDEDVMQLFKMPKRRRLRSTTEAGLFNETIDGRIKREVGIGA